MDQGEVAMPDRKKVVAINGSPHAGLGNTSQMIAMLRPHMEQEAFELEELFLSQYKINYCTGLRGLYTEGSLLDHRRLQECK